MKYLIYIAFIAAFLLLTFFGIGPVLFADGSTTERMITLLVVLVCYAVLFLLFYTWRKKKS